MKTNGLVTVQVALVLVPGAAPGSPVEGEVYYDSVGKTLQVYNGSAYQVVLTSITLTTLNASNLTSGTVPDARFPATLPAASGVNLTALNASALASGTVGTGRMGTGTANSADFLRGDGTWATTPIVCALTDGATPALNAAIGGVFTLAAAGDRTIAAPTNPIPGQKIIIAHTASGAIRTLALNSGAGGFRFGTDITGLTATASGKTDYIGAVYNLADSKWDVVAVTKGF